MKKVRTRKNYRANNHWVIGNVFLVSFGALMAVNSATANAEITTDINQEIKVKEKSIQSTANSVSETYTTQQSNTEKMTEEKTPLPKSISKNTINDKTFADLSDSKSARTIDEYIKYFNIPEAQAVELKAQIERAKAQPVVLAKGQTLNYKIEKVVMYPDQHYVLIYTDVPKEKASEIDSISSKIIDTNKKNVWKRGEPKKESLTRYPYGIDSTKTIYWGQTKTKQGKTNSFNLVESDNIGKKLQLTLESKDGKKSSPYQLTIPSSKLTDKKTEYENKLKVYINTAKQEADKLQQNKTLDETETTKMKSELDKFQQKLIAELSIDLPKKKGTPDMPAIFTDAQFNKFDTNKKQQIEKITKLVTKNLALLNTTYTNSKDRINNSQLLPDLSSEQRQQFEKEISDTKKYRVNDIIEAIYDDNDRDKKISQYSAAGVGAMEGFLLDAGDLNTLVGQHKQQIEADANTETNKINKLTHEVKKYEDMIKTKKTEAIKKLVEATLTPQKANAAVQTAKIDFTKTEVEATLNDKKTELSAKIKALLTDGSATIYTDELTTIFNKYKGNTEKATTQKQAAKQKAPGIKDLEDVYTKAKTEADKQKVDETKKKALEDLENKRDDLKTNIKIAEDEKETPNAELKELDSKVDSAFNKVKKDIAEKTIPEDIEEAKKQGLEELGKLEEEFENLSKIDDSNKDMPYSDDPGSAPTTPTPVLKNADETTKTADLLKKLGEAAEKAKTELMEHADSVVTDLTENYYKERLNNLTKESAKTGARIVDEIVADAKKEPLDPAKIELAIKRMPFKLTLDEKTPFLSDLQHTVDYWAGVIRHTVDNTAKTIVNELTDEIKNMTDDPQQKEGIERIRQSTLAEMAKPIDPKPGTPKTRRQTLTDEKLVEIRKAFKEGIDKLRAEKDRIVNADKQKADEAKQKALEELEDKYKDLKTNIKISIDEKENPDEKIKNLESEATNVFNKAKNVIEGKTSPEDIERAKKKGIDELNEIESRLAGYNNQYEGKNYPVTPSTVPVARNKTIQGLIDYGNGKKAELNDLTNVDKKIIEPIVKKDGAIDIIVKNATGKVNKVDDQKAIDKIVAEGKVAIDEVAKIMPEGKLEPKQKTDMSKMTKSVKVKMTSTNKMKSQDMKQIKAKTNNNKLPQTGEHVGILAMVTGFVITIFALLGRSITKGGDKHN